MQDLFAIWQAGVVGVAPDRLVRETVKYDQAAKVLCVQDEAVPLEKVGRIVVIGAGKGAGGMSLALEQTLLPIFGRQRLSGWVNVPEDCVVPTDAIHLHGARPPGLNEPTQAGVTGTREMLKRLHDLKPGDLCFCLFSGGGSALLPAPAAGITLEEKCELTRFLSTGGATINELNTVRKQLSEIKGGGIRRLCGGKTLFTLILSDVLGDPLDIIASGPTVENTTGPKEAVEVLDRWNLGTKSSPFANIYEYLRQKSGQGSRREVVDDSRHRNIVIGNNAVAVDAAGAEAERRGYSHVMVSARQSEGAAEEVGLHLLSIAEPMLQGGPNCLISGGEPTVRLPDGERHGKGGRNQQLILAVLSELYKDRRKFRLDSGPLHFEILSGGTDGEDGPTDAAGAFLNDTVWQNALSRSDLNPADFLARCDAYHYFEQVGGLLKTGPTGTNVCDLRVIIVRKPG